MRHSSVTLTPMKKLLLLMALVIGVSCRADDAVNTFRAGLQAFQANGPEALFRAWYTADAETKLSELRTRLTAVSSRLGPVIDTEVFAPTQIGKRVTRVYGVIYFQRRPLWVRADYYVAEGASGFVALEFSLKPDDVFAIER